MSNNFFYKYNNMFCADSNKNGIKKEDISNISALIDVAYNKVFENSDIETKAILQSVENEQLNDCENFADEICKNFDNFIILGIGGSSLGAKAILQTFLPIYYNTFDKKQRKGRPRYFVLDNIDPEKISELLSNLDLNKTFFCVISKSGTTIETLTQFFTFKDCLLNVVGEQWKKHFAVITGDNDGVLNKFAKSFNLKTFYIPKSLGGRFSIFSAVGLLPAAVFGINIKELLAGAKQLLNASKCKNIWNNAPLLSAALDYLNYKNGKNISVLVVYSEALGLIGEWYCQLWAESLGKNTFGQTPVSVLGTSAQHSQFQLYLDGPNDKVFTFLGVKNFRSDTQISKETKNALFYQQVGKYSSLFKVEREASISALTLSNKPNESILIEGINENIFGKIIMFFMLKTIFAGTMMNINPYGQPGVERIKQEIKNLSNNCDNEDLSKLIKI